MFGVLPIYVCAEIQKSRVLKMGSIRKTYGTDKSKEQEGVWITVAIDEEGIESKMKVRRMGQTNKEFTKRYATLGKKTRVMRGNKDKLQEQALREAFVETCLLEWENIENINVPIEKLADDPYMPCTKENAMKLFSEFPDLYDVAVGQAMEIESFQSEANEEEAKNSFPSSNIS